MVKAIGPCFSTGASGSVGDALTYASLGGLNIVKRKSKPSGEPSISQLSQRSSFSDAVAYWNAMDASERLTWDAEGRARALTGYNAFLSSFLQHPENFDMLPSGIILLWSGPIASIPEGWNLCDGNNGTPDLRDRFIVGAKQDDSGTAKTNLTGALTQSGGNANHTHTVSGNSNAASSGTTGYTSTSGVNSAYSLHTHSLSITSGNNSAVAVPYYALAFIMKA